MRDVEHSLCELDKILRVRNGARQAARSVLAAGYTRSDRRIRPRRYLRGFA